MAGDINQQLGFDVTQALEAVKSLDTAFGNLQGRFSSVAQTFQSFNSSGQQALSTLQAMTKAATSAASALDKLNSTGSGGSKVVGFAGASNLTQQATQIQTALSSVTQSSATVAQSLNNAGSQGQQAFQKATTSAAGFSVSLETVARVLATQVIVRSFNAIQNSLTGAFESFIEFNKAGAEVQTLLDQPLSKINADLHSLSDAFNIPILDVAKAKYEALSNGFTDASENAQLLDAAFQFSKIGISSATEAVDLLSTALNAYGLSADSAAGLSSKFFRAIDLGRFTAKDLVNSFGRVAPIANELGVSIDELLAGFSSLTVGGVKSSEAATQLRSTLASLLKPSEDMKAAFKALGVDSGEALIGAYGFQGALLAVKDTTDGSASAVAKLFPNIRALSGVFRETETGLAVFSDHLEEIRKTTSEVLNQTYHVRVESDAEKVSADLNKLKNFFTAELGKSLVESVAKLLQFVGGVDTLTSAIQNFVPVLGAAAIGLGAWGISAGLAATATKLFTVASAESAGTLAVFGAAFAPVVVAALALLAAYDTIVDRTQKSLDASMKARLDAANDEITIERNKNDAIANLTDQVEQTKLRFINQGLAAAEKAADEQLKKIKETNDQYVIDTKNAMDHAVQAREKGANDIARDAQRAEQDAISAHKKAIDIRGQMDDERFNFVNRRFNAQQQIFREVTRSQQLARAGQRLGTANTEAEKEAGKQAFNRAEQYARQALSSAEQSGNLSLQVKAQKNLLDIQNQRLTAEVKEETTRKNAANRLSAQAAVDKESVDRLKQYQSEFVKNASLFDKDGNRLDDKQIAENKPKALDALRKFNNELAKGAPLSVADLLNFDQLKQRLLQNLTPPELKDLKIAQSEFSSLADQIVNGINAQRKVITGFSVDKNGIKDTDSQNDIKNTVHQQLSAAIEESKLQTQGKSARDTDFAAQTILANAGQAALRSQPTTGQVLGNAFASIPRLALQSVTTNTAKLPIDNPDNPNFATNSRVQKLKSDINEMFEAAKQNPDIPIVGRLAQLHNEANAITKIAPHMFDIDTSRIDGALKIADEFAQKQQNEQQRQKQGISEQRFQESQQNINAVAAPALDNKLKAQEDAAKATQNEAAAAAPVAAAAASTASSSANSAGALISMAGSSATLADNMERAATASRTIAQGGGGGGGGGSEENQAFGGVIRKYFTGGIASQFYAGGGQARGTDTIPAMLSPGEFVMNAASTQKFYSQLVAMNADRPIHRAEGGSVSNVNVGGITINASPNPMQTAREVQQLLRREARRGSSLI